jgi:hypothetical protein
MLLVAAPILRWSQGLRITQKALQGRRESIRAPMEKNFSGPHPSPFTPSKGGPNENLCTNRKDRLSIGESLGLGLYKG